MGVLDLDTQVRFQPKDAALKPRVPVWQQPAPAAPPAFAWGTDFGPLDISTDYQGEDQLQPWTPVEPQYQDTPVMPSQDPYWDDGAQAWRDPQSGLLWNETDQMWSATPYHPPERAPNSFTDFQPMEDPNRQGDSGQWIWDRARQSDADAQFLASQQQDPFSAPVEYSTHAGPDWAGWDTSLGGLAGRAGRAFSEFQSGNEWLGALGLNAADLPYGLPYITDVAASPLTLLTAGAGPEAGVLSSAFGGNFAQRLAGETAVGSAGLLSSSLADQALPGDMNPWVRGALTTGAGLVGGVGAYGALKGVEAAGPSIGRVLKSELGDLPEGAAALSEQGGGYIPSLRDKFTGQDAERVLDDPFLPAPEAAPKSGTDLAARALLEHNETTKAPGPVGQFVGEHVPAAKEAAGIFNPAASEEQRVIVAMKGRASAEAEVATRLAESQPQAIRDIKDAMDSAPPAYHGPADNPIEGTFLDIAQNPQWYDLSESQRLALRRWDNRNTNSIYHINGGYGTEVPLFKPENAESVYVPNLQANKDILDAVEKTTQQMSQRSLTGERMWQTAYERMKSDPKFQPVTDVEELTKLHDQAIANAAGKSTFGLGVGGLTRPQVMELTHPELVAKRTAVAKLVDSLAGRVQTAEARFARADAANAIYQRETLKAADRRDSLLARIFGRETTAAEKRQAAIDMYSEARQALTQARNDALAAAKETGEQGSSKAADQKLNRLLKKADALGEKYQGAQRAEDMAAFALSETPARPGGRSVATGMEHLTVREAPSTRAELKAFWDDVHRLQNDVAEAASAKRDAINSVRNLPVGEAAARAEAAPLAEKAASETRQALAEAEQTAQRAALARGETDVDAVLAGMDAQAALLETRIRQMARLTNSTAARRGDQNSLLAGLRDALDDVRQQQRELGRDYKNAHIPEDQFVQSKITNLYHPPEVKASIDRVSQTGFGPTFKGKLEKWALNPMSTVTQTAFNLDISRATIQGAFRLASHPIAGAESLLKQALMGKTGLEDLIATEPEMVQRFARARMRAVGSVAPEFETGGSLVLKIPKLGPAYKTFEEHLDRVLTRLDYDMWKSNVDFLKRVNPTMSERVVDAEAANAVSKFGLALSNADRGQSVLEARLMRAPITSPSFLASPILLAKDMSSGLAKLPYALAANKGDVAAAWQSLRGREQIALYRGAQMATSLGAVTAASAALSAGAMGESIPDAIKENFDPGSKYFLSIRLGPYAAIPVGGPLRSAIRGLLPTYQDGEWLAPDLGQFAMGRLSPVPRFLAEQIKNEDFQGNQIRQGGFAESWARAIEYGVESGLPLTIGAAVQDARTGDYGKIAQDVGSQLGGVNTIYPTEYEGYQRDLRAAFEDYSAKLKVNGKESSYPKPSEPNDDPLFALQYAKGDPKPDPTSLLGKQLMGIREGTPQMPGYTKIMAGNDNLGEAGTITLDKWREERKKNKYAMGNEISRALALHDSGEPAQPGTPREWWDSYSQIFQDATIPGTSVLDTNKVDELEAAWMKAHEIGGDGGATAKAYVDALTYERTTPGIERDYIRAMQQLASDGYFDRTKLPHYKDLSSGVPEDQLEVMAEKVPPTPAGGDWLDTAYAYYHGKIPDAQLLDIMRIHEAQNALGTEKAHDGDSWLNPDYYKYRQANKDLLKWFDPKAHYSDVRHFGD